MGSKCLIKESKITFHMSFGEIFKIPKMEADSFFTSMDSKHTNIVLFFFPFFSFFLCLD